MLVLCAGLGTIMWLLRHIRKYLAVDMANTIACSVVGFRLDYCNSILYKTTKATITKLQRVQNSLACGATANVVHHDRDLHFQGHEFGYDRIAIYERISHNSNEYSFWCDVRWKIHHYFVPKISLHFASCPGGVEFGETNTVSLVASWSTSSRYIFFIYEFEFYKVCGGGRFKAITLWK